MNSNTTLQLPTIRIPAPALQSASVADGNDGSPSRREALALGVPEPYQLDAAKQLPAGRFPNPPGKPDQGPISTIVNVQHLLSSYGITARYDVVKKKTLIAIPGHSGSPDNFDNVALTRILSLVTLNGMFVGPIASIVEAIADQHQFNPVAEWIHTKPWDGTDRLPAVYATLIEREGFPRDLKETLVYRWLLSAVAAALMPSGFHCRGVLTLQGPQGIGKTRWTNSLVPDAQLAKDLIKLDHHLDPGDKDSRLSAITHWIVEIGELDGSLRKDIARLKGFLTADQDKVRRPYGRMDSEYQRRTVFCATVNDANFLVDPTGNKRWWTIPLVSIDYEHGIDMQQVFAQLAVEFNNGNQWWLTADEERLLDEQNKRHESVSAIRERILDKLDLEEIGKDGLRAMTCTEVLRAIHVENPTNSQCKECGAVLRELLGDPKRIHGREKWRIPFREVDTSDL